jgi:ABC-type amino acid transport substrate-binding protein
MGFIKSILAGFSVAAICMTAFVTPSTADTLAKIKAEGKVVIGNGAAFPPFEFVEDGKLVGYDIDFGEELARRMGVQAEWTKIEFRGIIAGLTSKRVDMLVTAMAYTPERASRISFSEPYFMTGVAAGYRSDLNIQTASDLAGLNIGVQLGTSGERFVRQNLEGQIASLKTYDEFLLAIRDLEAGRVDAVVNTGPTIAYNLKQRGGDFKVTENFDSRIIGVNTRQEDTALMAEINKHIIDLKEEGFFTKLDLKWFGREMQHSPTP